MHVAINVEALSATVRPGQRAITGLSTAGRAVAAAQARASWTALEGEDMALLHYGSELQIQLDAATTRQVMEAAGAHATRGGWVTATDTDGHEWSFLVTAGIPIWITEKQ
jgi:hypothetical protein